MTHSVYERIERAGNEETLPVYLNPPCGFDDLQEFRRRSRDELGESAQWYESLLHISDGLQIDNCTFESAPGLVEMNLELRAQDRSFDDYIIFGSSGNVELYVYDRRATERSFRIVNFFEVGEVYEEYPSFEDLLSAPLDASSL